MTWMIGIESDEERDDEDGDGDGHEGEGNEDGRGSQATSKALILFLVDCHLNMHRLYKFNDGTKSDEKITETTYFKRVFKKLHAICRDKLKKGQLDHVGIVLFNSKDMGNKWNNESCKVEIPLKELDKDTIDHLFELSQPTGSKGALPHATAFCHTSDKSHLELGLWTCTNTFNDIEKNSLETAQKGIYVFTCNSDNADLGFKKNKYQESCLQRVKDAVAQGILIDVWPLRVQVPDDDDLSFFEAISLADDDGPMQADFKNADFFKNLLHESIDEKNPCAIYSDTKEEEIEDRLQTRLVGALGVELQAGLNNRSQASLVWTVKPHSSNPLKIAVKLFSLSMEVKKKPPIKVKKQTNQATKTDTERIDKETGRKLDQQQIEGYFKFGADEIVLSKGEERAKRGDGETGIETLGFAPKDEVLRPGHNLRACWFMHPDEKTAANSSTAFTSFLQVLLEEDKVAVCRIQKRSNETPRFHALVPQRREAGDVTRSLRVPEGFYVVPLPFADDIRSLPPGFALSDEHKPDHAAVAEARKLVKELGDDSFMKRLQNGQMPNPSLLKNFAHVEAHALGKVVDPQDPVIDLDEAMENVNPPRDWSTGLLADKIKPKVEALKAAISDQYDTELDSKVAGKRKREVDPEAAKVAAAKKEEMKHRASEIDWQEILANGTLNKRTIPDLKAYCQNNGLHFSSSAKKQDLLDLVGNHLQRS